jgi:hypothetical protein
MGGYRLIDNKYISHLNIIARQIKNNKAVLFVGAGFSKNAQLKNGIRESKFKDWNEFIFQLGRMLWPKVDENELNKKIGGNYLHR